ncbi:hypothetical protein CYMTET_49301 [Cymbomonas tetramitiformis]|uniref:Ubiquilin n=1 Tax=Cymbomonas tetramitiformis TaxID=36881 RepID=A0AAE0BSF9_9CHLO|nr:hypothetical protein CYMTET_49301 [Cymbomonas tetramitiformis]
MAPVKISVKFSQSKFDIDVEISQSIGDVKALLVQHSSVPVSQQRLIFKGRVLKDEQTLESIGVEVGHTLYLVKGTPPAGQASATPPRQTQTTPAPSTAPSSSPTQDVDNLGGATGLGSFGDLPGLGGLGGLGGPGGGNLGESFERFQQQVQQNPDMMRDILNSPMMQGMMQNLTNNPDMLRGMVESNPALRQVMERNPELAHVLNDPSVLRQTLEVARNPDLMREQMRSTDRALSNIEAHPEGFNMLRRMYENVQQPLLNAATGAQDDAPAQDAPANPFADLFAQGGGSPTPGAPNTAPLPNPWAPAGTGGSPLGATTPAPSTPAATPGVPSLNNGLAQPGGGLFGAGADASELANMMQQPGMREMTDMALRTMQGNPALMEQMLNANPQTRTMLDSNPQLRGLLTNPEFMRQMMDPNTLQSIAQVQNLMRGMPGGAPGAQGTPGAPGAASPFANLFDPLNAGPLRGAAPATTPSQPPEELYASQIQQLKDMGFSDEQANVRALVATGGNVNVAVERLLGQL